MSVTERKFLYLLIDYLIRSVIIISTLWNTSFCLYYLWFSINSATVSFTLFLCRVQLWAERNKILEWIITWLLANVELLPALILCSILLIRMQKPTKTDSWNRYIFFEINLIVENMVRSAVPVITLILSALACMVRVTTYLSKNSLQLNYISIVKYVP